MWRRYLMWFAHEHVDFRHAEMNSILSLFNIPIKFIEKPSVIRPYWIVELPSEECVKKIASRSVLLKNCIELWSRAKTVSQLHKNLKGSVENSTGEWIIGDSEHDGISDSHLCPKELIESCCSVKSSFKIEVETFCKHFTMKEKVEKIETFSYLPLEGPVKLKNPDVTLAYLEFYGVDPNNVPEEPHDVFFGKWVVDGQRDLIQVHSLKKRQFIGNTSMDAQLSIIMANQAQVRRADLVLDPFVGSGSLLVPAAHFGAHVWGSDIDFMMLHARTRPTRVGQKVRTKDESIRGNMRQYGIESQYLDVVVSDFSMPMWRPDLKFDAIITDPPYGVREPTERIGIDREQYSLSEEHMVNHIPAKVEYGLPHIYRDLLNFAARHLQLGRRLVCWYPLVREEYKEAQLPSHPCFKLVSNSEQVLSKLTARRLLTYEKVHDDVSQETVEPNDASYNFREKYFSVGEETRRERKERKAEELATNPLWRAAKNRENAT
ncbi:tRNA (guanine(10)-N(2))-methyltransferase TRMT11 [Anticarsia gemmatalis]|uniref:tRNA (guanine(10)-N(2))-methyltransferase TRMT11 n=1 Tax=Anticarsia gemmatalis TaxID=129554 RepID=UPI003F757DE9